MSERSNFTNRAIRENPLLVIGLGICPALATTTTALTGLGMGLATAAVLFMSALIISRLTDFIPGKVRLPACIIVIATIVTIVDLLMQAYTPALSGQLGIFVPLIAANGILLARAEVLAPQNKVFSSVSNTLSMGLGFSLLLTLTGSIREMLATGTVFGHPLIAGETNGILVFIMAPGAFITLGFLIALIRSINKKHE